MLLSCAVRELVVGIDGPLIEVLSKQDNLCNAEWRNKTCRAHVPLDAGLLVLLARADN